MEAKDIPPTQRAAGVTFGKLVSQNIVESKDAVESLFGACLKAGYVGDDAGLRTRLWWIVRDAAEEWRHVRIKTEYAIRSAMTPLMIERADAVAILRAAYGANSAAGSPFLKHEVLDFAREEMRAFIAGKQRRGAYGR